MKPPTYTELVHALTQLVFMARTYGNAQELIVACQKAEAIINAASKEQV